jgi:hypothetical protein
MGGGAWGAPGRPRASAAPPLPYKRQRLRGGRARRCDSLRLATSGQADDSRPQGTPML